MDRQEILTRILGKDSSFIWQLRNCRGTAAYDIVLNLIWNSVYENLLEEKTELDKKLALMKSA